MTNTFSFAVKDVPKIDDNISDSLFREDLQSLVKNQQTKDDISVADTNTDLRRNGAMVLEINDELINLVDMAEKAMPGKKEEVDYHKFISKYLTKEVGFSSEQSDYILAKSSQGRFAAPSTLAINTIGNLTMDTIEEGRQPFHAEQGATTKINIDRDGKATLQYSSKVAFDKFDYNVSDYGQDAVNKIKSDDFVVINTSVKMGAAGTKEFKPDIEIDLASEGKTGGKFVEEFSKNIKPSIEQATNSEIIASHKKYGEISKFLGRDAKHKQNISDKIEKIFNSKEKIDKKEIEFLKRFPEAEKAIEDSIKKPKELLHMLEKSANEYKNSELGDIYKSAAKNLKETIGSKEFTEVNRTEQKQQIKESMQEFRKSVKEIELNRNFHETGLAHTTQNIDDKQMADLIKADRLTKKITRPPSKMSEIKKEVKKIVSVMQEKGLKAVKPIAQKITKNKGAQRG